MDSVQATNYIMEKASKEALRYLPPSTPQHVKAQRAMASTAYVKAVRNYRHSRFAQSRLWALQSLKFFFGAHSDVYQECYLLNQRFVTI